MAKTAAAKKAKSLADKVAEVMPELGPTSEQKAQAAENFAAQVPAGKVLQLPVRYLRESETNLRKSFTDIPQLAEAMKNTGWVSPLVVRPIEGTKLYEIVAGARRFRAGERIGLKELPCEVRKLSDVQADELMLIENGQRADLHAMEEAEGMDRLIEAHHYTVPQVAAKVGKSKGHVYARLKLLALCKEARAAFTGGMFDPTVAVPLARIHSHKAQREALARIANMSSRDAIAYLTTEHTQTLKGAPFNLKDEDLVPKRMEEVAGRLVSFGGSCMKCPHRSGSVAGPLFQDIQQGHDTCTLTPCFAEKREAAWKIASASAKAKGWEVYSAAEGRKLFTRENTIAPGADLVLASAPADNDPKRRTWKELIGKLPEDKRPPTLFVPDRASKGRECYARAKALEVLAGNQKWAASEARAAAREDAAGDPEKFAAERAKRAIRDRVLLAVLEKASEGVEELRLPELRILALAFDRAAEDDEALARRKLTDATVEKWISEKATAKDLARFIFELGLRLYLGNTFEGYTPELKAMAEHVRIDVKAMEKLFTAEAEAVATSEANKATAEALMTKPEGGDAF